MKDQINIKKLSWKKVISSWGETESHSGSINGIQLMVIIHINFKNQNHYCIFVPGEMKYIIGVHGNEGYKKWGKFYDLKEAKDKCYDILNKSIKKLLK